MSEEYILLVKLSDDLERAALQFHNNAQASRKGVYISAEEWDRDRESLLSAMRAVKSAIAFKGSYL